LCVVFIHVCVLYLFKKMCQNNIFLSKYTKIKEYFIQHNFYVKNNFSRNIDLVRNWELVLWLTNIQHWKDLLNKLQPVDTKKMNLFWWMPDIIRKQMTRTLIQIFFINKNLGELNSETHYGQAGLKVQKAPTDRLYTNEVLTP
jgi:hypothetical protein